MIVSVSKKRSASLSNVRELLLRGVDCRSKIWCLRFSRNQIPTNPICEGIVFVTMCFVTTRALHDTDSELEDGSLFGVLVGENTIPRYPFFNMFHSCDALPNLRVKSGLPNGCSLQGRQARADSFFRSIVLAVAPNCRFAVHQPCSQKSKKQKEQWNMARREG